MKEPSGLANERIYYEALKRIAGYQPVEWLRKHSEREFGLSFQEALEFAYENVVTTAKFAIKGKRKPKERA